MNFDDLINQTLNTEDIVDEGLGKALASGALAAGLTFGGIGGANAATKAPIHQTDTRPRGIRNNNPGNIERGKDQWQGMSKNQKDPRFITFQSVPHGLRAIGIILRNYDKKYNLNTIEGMINRWAPPSENDTEAYIQSVERTTGFARNQKLNLNDKETLKKLINAIVIQENGKQYAYKDAILNAAVDLI